ncbi:site-specific integrase [uncultured Paraglaciecola sp.]|mgnify:CR=1 FL=1|uniref:site-specific integrase n=1 Tax=uncultured Paraglaciecola sp. TaxID=1765024 RepID=UPI002636E190|nr:site-specific integrase [uncultured Paraglaciecola sp.]
MGKFARADRQAASVMKLLQGNVLRSAGTVRNYEQALTRVAEYAKAERVTGGLRGMDPQQAITYLKHRGQSVGQKTLDMERQAMQAMMWHVSAKLPPKERLPVIKADTAQVLKARAYTQAQVERVASAQSHKNALATRLAYAAGLRAHELHSLMPVAERGADHRPALPSKFQGREGQRYTVQGKGGLVREVVIPNPLAQQLSGLRLAEPMTFTDRGVHYPKYYDLNGGKTWSSSFSAASTRALGWSAGAHGVRHSYAQERMSELQDQGFTRAQALETVSQEMGHFRPDITETYLR